MVIDTKNIGRLRGRELANSFPVMPIERQKLTAEHMLSGMITRLPRGQIPITAGTLYRNARTRDDWLGRRPGTMNFRGNPSAEPVLGIITFISEARNVFICRITESSFYVTVPSAADWVAYTITDVNGSPASFPASARFGFTQFFDKLYLTDGVHPIWEVDFVNQTVKQIKDSPVAKYIMTFADRLVVGNLKLPVGGDRPASYAWCVNADPYDWSGYSSGVEDLGYDNIGDEITGLVALEQGGVIVRRRSLSSLTRQPFQQPVFRADPLVQGFGCDLPYSIARVPNGFIFADQATRSVNFFSFGQGIQNLSDTISRDLVDDITSLEFAQGVYDPFEQEYHLGVIRGSEIYINRTWVRALQYGGWGYDDSPEVSCIGLISLPATGVTIDELVGTIDSQTVSNPMITIDEYGTPSQFRMTLFKGLESGQIIQQDYSADHDYDGTKFELEYISPNIGHQAVDRLMKGLLVRSLAEKGGEYKLDLMNQTGYWRHLKTDTLPANAERRNLRIPKRTIKGEDLFWRIRTSAPGIKLYTWTVEVQEKVMQK